MQQDLVDMVDSEFVEKVVKKIKSDKSNSRNSQEIIEKVSSEQLLFLNVYRATEKVLSDKNFRKEVRFNDYSSLEAYSRVMCAICELNNIKLDQKFNYQVPQKTSYS